MINNNDTVHEFQWGSGGGEPAPEGFHDLEFLGTERMPARELNGTLMDEAVRFKFKVVGGPHTGKFTSNCGPVKPTDNNVSGRLLKGLLGSAGRPGETVSVKDCIGKVYIGVVQNNKNARPVVISVNSKS